MTISLALILSAALSSAAAPVHETRVEHRGIAYQVSYEPHVTTQMRTVGISAGPRPSTQRCRWQAEVQVKRLIRREGHNVGHDRLLPTVHRYEGSRDGSCKMAADAVKSEQFAKLDGLTTRLAAVATTDRVAALADIDAAHALAAN